MKKRSKKSLLDKAKKDCEQAWKDACHRRDKSRCQMCGATKEKGAIVQVDHCFSRTIKELFYSPKNGTVLCSGCHTQKTFNVKGMEKRVDDFVRRREGEAWWAYALRSAETSGPVKFYLDDLEAIKADLDKQFR